MDRFRVLTLIHLTQDRTRLNILTPLKRKKERKKEKERIKERKKEERKKERKKKKENKRKKERNCAKFSGANIGRQHFLLPARTMKMFLPQDVKP